MPRRVVKPVATRNDSELDSQEQSHSQHDDVDQNMASDDEAPVQQPLARSKRTNISKKSKSKPGKSKQDKISKSHAPHDAQSSDDDAEDVPFDKDKFLATARPISNKSASKIVGLASDWGKLRHQVQTTGYTLVTETAVAVEEVSGNTEEGLKAVNELDTVMRKLIDAEKELAIQEESLKALQARVTSGEIIDKLEDEYEARAEESIRTYSHLTTRMKYSKNKEYFKFREHLWEVNHEDAMPPMRDLIPREDADSDPESDIEVGGMTQDYKCPLTLTHLQNPVTSKHCNHSFSAEAIAEYLKDTRGKKACPATGCSQWLSMADLEPNRELAKRAADAARRAKRKEEDSDDEEEEVID